jgi:hypothetical protein
MRRAFRILGVTLLFVIAAAALTLAVMAFGDAGANMPSEPHHGQAVDGLDGIGTLFALFEGGAGIVLLVIGGVALASAIKGVQELRRAAAAPRAVALPTAYAHEVARPPANPLKLER